MMLPTIYSDEWLVRVRKRLIYDALLGNFIWVKGAGRGATGTIAGAIRANGYRYITVEGKLISAHRLAWLFAGKKLPSPELSLDHINRERDDNRIENLRIATRSYQMRNSGAHNDSTSKYKGVCFDSTRGKWKIIFHGPNEKIQKRFNTEKDAALAWDQLALTNYGPETFLNFPRSKP